MSVCGVCKHTYTLESSALKGQKKMLDALELQLQIAVSCEHRELNSDPLKEKQVPLTTELLSRPPRPPFSVSFLQNKTSL